MDIKKNDYLNVDIIDLNTNAQGVAKVDNFVIFVPDALPLENIDIKIIQVKKNFAYGKIIRTKKVSPHRVKAPCKYFGSCGGCNLMHLEYNKQLELKSSFVKNNLKKIAGVNDIEIEPAIGLDYPFYYRNKASFPVNFYNRVNIGFYKMRSHDVVNIDSCIIQNKVNDNVIKCMHKFISDTNISIYDENKHNGILRHIVTRVCHKTSNLLVCIVVNCRDFRYKKELIDSLQNIDNIKSIVINYNTKCSNTILGDKIEAIYGDNYIMSYIDDLEFKISPTSFFQVNSPQTSKLYKIAIDFCDLKGSEIVFDMYCGIGTISLMLAKHSKKVYGVEIAPFAVKNAKENAKINNISNTNFICGKSEDIIKELIDKDITPNIIVLDPPRKGLEKCLIDTISYIKMDKIVYISCDSATLSRDISYFKEYGFKVLKVKTIDMFCNTTHIECVVLLERSL